MALVPFTQTTAVESVPAGLSTVPKVGWIDITSRVAQGYTHYAVAFDASAWTAAQDISLNIWFTQDGGATLISGGGMSGPGGNYTDVHTGLPKWPNVDAALPAAGPNGLMVRADVTVPTAGQTQARVTLSQT